MKKATRFLALLMCVVSLVSVFAFPASAKTVKTYNCAAGSGKSAFFYVRTGTSSSSRKITLKMDRGYIQATNCSTYKSSMVMVYGAYEIKVFYKDSKGNWQLEQDYDVYNKSSATITCNKKSTDYRIQVYSWNVNTIFKSYHKNNVSARTGWGSTKFAKFFSDSANSYTKISWYSTPKCTASPNSGCTMYDSPSFK